MVIIPFLYPVNPKPYDMLRIFWLLSVVVVSTIIPAWGKVRLPALVGDHMVLQQKSDVILWGWCNPGEEVTVRPSWTDKIFSTSGTNMAKWQVVIQTPNAGGPFQIEITAGESIILKDILIGEVWICSGQSNMDWSPNHGFDHAEEEVQRANYPKIRFFKMPRTTADFPQDNCSGNWEICSPMTFRDFSAAAYFFGRDLHNKLDVPIGLIQTSWGGTPAEVWTSAEWINRDPQYISESKKLGESAYWPTLPGSTFNAMIHPLGKFRIAGAIWYQGESNTANPVNYRRLFPDMINCWRELWGYSFPFYYVQIAPYRYGTPFVGALVREAQLMALATENAGMAVISDIGDVYDIHPRNKIEVGKRLANWALSKTYNIETPQISGPLYRSYEIEGDQIRIFFDYAENGLMSKNGLLTDFEIAGNDYYFYPARADIEDSTVIVRSDFVLSPVAARFAFTNTATPNLFNQEGLPASTFRTDNWPINVQNIDMDISFEPEYDAYLVALSSPLGRSAEIRYTLNGDRPNPYSLIYNTPFFIRDNCTLNAVVVINDKPADNVVSRDLVFSKATFRKIQYETSFSSQYTGGGEKALIDGLRGTLNYQDGRWQGFHGESLIATIDMGKEMELYAIEVNCLKHPGNSIFEPKKVSYEISRDGSKFNEIYRHPVFHVKNEKHEIVSYRIDLRGRKTQFVRINVENMGECPQWHPNAGQKSWLFIDEIIIE